MGLACDVYTKLLFHRGHGYPLWEPEPTKAGEVLIGDVGYVLEGSFYRLFNTTLPAGHAVHQHYGVPDGYEPFVYPDALLHRRAHALQPGPICSTSVIAKSVEASVGVGMGSPGVVGQLRFKCADEQGAVLVLKEDGAREALHPSKDLIQYIACNHESWHRFAQDVFRLDIGESDILFVSGCIKTGAWALAAATHRAREGELVFGGTFGTLGQATFSVSAEEKITMSVEHRCGPKSFKGDAEDKRDQCVFLHYYKVKRRRVLGPKVIRAASGEEAFPGSRSPSPDEFVGDAICELVSGSLECVPGLTKFRDPVNSILDYILDHTDASCAIASDQDLKVIYQLDPDRTSDDVYQTLAKIQPTLGVIGNGSVGMLQTTGPYGALSTIPEDAPVASTSSPATLFRISLTPTNTPPHLRNSVRRLKSPSTHRRQRSHSVKRFRSCTPTPTPLPTAGSPEHPLDYGAEPETVTPDAPPKRKQGRPPGSKNKKSLAVEAASIASASTSLKRPRGRRPKTEPENGPSLILAGGSSMAESPPKKKRGRPPKNPAPDLEDLEAPPSKRRKA